MAHRVLSDDRGTIAPSTGVGLKAEHYRKIIDAEPDIGFFEVHAENYMGAGGPPHRYLEAIRARYELSLHGVGLSIGADRPLDREHLRRLRGLIDRYSPKHFSEHLAWSSHDSGFLNDLLPLPYTAETLVRVCEHIDEVQTTLGRQMLLENPSTYLAFAESNWSEVEFIAEVVRRTGCGLLLDVNNVYVSSTNHQLDPTAYIDAYPLAHIQQIHLAGYARDADEMGRPLLIDAHDRQVDEIVWGLYTHAIRRLGSTPTLIEWDANVPAWPVLEAEAQRAKAIMTAVRHAPHEVRELHELHELEDAHETHEALRIVPRLAERQHGFARALLDPHRPLPPGLVGPDGEPSERRFAVYRNNVVSGLIDTLQAAFPAVSRIVGSEFFRAMARVYCAQEPPDSPILLGYGAGFPDFIGTFEPAATLPYLPDVARIEHAWAGAYHAVDAAPLDPAALAQIAPDELAGLGLRLSPSVRLIRSLFPALTIWRMNVDDGVPAPVDLESGGENVLVARPGAEVELRLLSPASAEFIQSLIDGQPMIDAASAALAVDGGFDLSLNLVELLQSAIVIDLLPLQGARAHLEGSRA
ncbi:MAG: DUF692 family multinuclear iron-containing protein [Rubrivivax sp.]